MPRTRSTRGFALVAVLLWLTLFSTLALGVALATSAEPPASGALHERLRLQRAAESAVALVVAWLAAAPDWTFVPSAAVSTPFTDGVPGPRRFGSSTIDLAAETARRTCGRTGPCDEASTTAAAPGRPWGARNPRWRLVLYLPLATIDAVAGAICPCYLVGWVADDPADDDGDPLQDASTGVAGHGVLLVRGAAIGDNGAVAEIEALVSQPCTRSATTCAGIRVQSWSTVNQETP